MSSSAGLVVGLGVDTGVETDVGTGVETTEETGEEEEQEFTHTASTKSIILSIIILNPLSIHLHLDVNNMFGTPYAF